MKIIVTIWTLYIFSLTLMPCDDSSIVTSADAYSSIQQNTNDETTDFCSPFCLCSCCAAHVNISSVLTSVTDQLLSHNTQLNSFYIVGMKSSPTYSIWQPPKI